MTFTKTLILLVTSVFLYSCVSLSGGTIGRINKEPVITIIVKPLELKTMPPVQLYQCDEFGNCHRLYMEAK